MGREEEDDGKLFFSRLGGPYRSTLNQRWAPCTEDFSVHLGLFQWIGFGFGKEERNKRQGFFFFFGKTSNKALCFRLISNKDMSFKIFQISP